MLYPVANLAGLALWREQAKFAGLALWRESGKSKILPSIVFFSHVDCISNAVTFLVHRKALQRHFPQRSRYRKQQWTMTLK
jgi:hypothetical protein